MAKYNDNDLDDILSIDDDFKDVNTLYNNENSFSSEGYFSSTGTLDKEYGKLKDNMKIFKDGLSTVPESMGWLRRKVYFLREKASGKHMLSNARTILHKYERIVEDATKQAAELQKRTERQMRNVRYYQDRKEMLEKKLEDVKKILPEVEGNYKKAETLYQRFKQKLDNGEEVVVKTKDGEQKLGRSYLAKQEKDLDAIKRSYENLLEKVSTLDQAVINNDLLLEIAKSTLDRNLLNRRTFKEQRESALQTYRVVKAELSDMIEDLNLYIQRGRLYLAEKGLKNLYGTVNVSHATFGAETSKQHAESQQTFLLSDKNIDQIANADEASINYLIDGKKEARQLADKRRAHLAELQNRKKKLTLQSGETKQEKKLLSEADSMQEGLAQALGVDLPEGIDNLPDDDK